MQTILYFSNDIIIIILGRKLTEKLGFTIWQWASGSYIRSIQQGRQGDRGLNTYKQVVEAVIVEDWIWSLTQTGNLGTRNEFHSGLISPFPLLPQQPTTPTGYFYLCPVIGPQVHLPGSWIGKVSAGSIREPSNHVCVGIDCMEIGEIGLNGSVLNGRRPYVG